MIVFFLCLTQTVRILISDYSTNVTVEGSAHPADQNQLAAIPKGENLPPAPIDGSIDKWFFISGAAV